MKLELGLICESTVATSLNPRKKANLTRNRKNEKSIFRIRPPSPTIMLRTLHVFNHSVVVIYFLLCEQILIWNLVVSVFIYFFLGCFGISLGYHRYLSHKSFEPRPLFNNLMIFLGMISCGGSPLSWASAHRYHHLHTDKDKDIHSVKRDGWLKVYFHLWRPFYIKARMIKDLLSDKKILFLHRYYFLLVGAWAVLLYSISIKAGIYGFSIPAILSFHFYGLVNVMGHAFGSRPLTTDDTTTNHWFVNIFVFGEGWHQNHHLIQSSHRIGLRPGELDISAWFIETFPLSRDWLHLKKKSQRAREKLEAMESEEKHDLAPEGPRA